MRCFFNNPATIYHKERNNLFSIYNKDGFKKGVDYLEKEIKGKLPYNAYIGLKSEFFFFEKYKKEFKLTPALDCGDHADFVGIVNGEVCCIDVTTSLKYKKLQDYEHFQRKEGKKYKIALMDYKENQLIEIIDINFPFCPECGGRLFDIVIVPQSESKMEGISDYQKIVKVCCNNPYEHYAIKDKVSYVPIHTFEFLENELKANSKDIKKELEEYAITLVQFFKKEVDPCVFGCGGEIYVTTTPDGDGFWGTKMYWRHALILDYIEEIYDIIFDLWNQNSRLKGI